MGHTHIHAHTHTQFYNAKAELTRLNRYNFFNRYFIVFYFVVEENKTMLLWIML